VLGGTGAYGSIGRLTGMAIPQAYHFLNKRIKAESQNILFMWFHRLRLLQNYENRFGILLDTWDRRSTQQRARQTIKK
jgi:hypothetical protein